jgi:hypothetical protein
MGCLDLDSLQARYRKAVDDYVAVVRKLRNHTIGVPHAEFMVLWHTCEYTKDKCAEAQRLLEKHIFEHNCGSPSTSTPPVGLK